MFDDCDLLGLVACWDDYIAFLAFSKVDCGGVSCHICVTHFL